LITAGHALLRRIAAGLTALAIGSSAAGSADAAGRAMQPPPPGNHAAAAALIDVASGRILFSQRGDEPMRIASLTKIMTAIVAIENGNLNDTVTVGTRAAGVEGSSLYLKAGQKIALLDLLYGLMLRSGNDAAIAIAEHVGGSLDGFVYLMNKKAEELGLNRSHFANPHGLDQDGHYMSANDLARLSAYALRNPTFARIVKTRVRTAPNPYEPWDYKWVNKNKMLTMYEGADGVKTGYTKLALRTLVSSATRGGQQLAAVTLNDGDDWADHRNLLDYGFRNFRLTEVVRKGEPIAGHPYAASASFSYPFSEGERERLRIKLVPLRTDSVMFALGYRGWLRFVLDGREIGSVPLVDRSPPGAGEGRSGSGTAPADPDGTGADKAAERPAVTRSDAFRKSLRALLFGGV
jgi:D-alanyl-D-alanine carboxypeptidase